ncbi:MAG: beta-lactamase family protein [Saprospiraceae bacterium]|nr:beta-lactamase family protein [Saprospiraceae bacterium]
MLPLKFWIYILFTSCPLFLIGQESPLKQEINKIIQYDSDISFELTPGFIVGILDQDSVYFLAFGNDLSNAQMPLDKNDVFELGSISKSLTAVLIHQLQQAGLLDLNDPLNKYLPIDSQNPRMADLTLYDLLNHKAPFPRRPSWFGEFEEDPQNPYQYYSKDDLLRFYSQFVPQRPVEFNYAHINYALLEIVAETVSNTDFETALLHYVLEPLGMKETFVNFKEKKENVLALGIDRSRTPTLPWDFNSFAASEGIKSSANDLLLFARAFFGTSGTGLDQLCPSLTTLNEPSFNEKLFYSFGWHGIKINKKTRAIISNGNTSGHSAFMGMVPETKTAVVVLSNSAFGTKDLGLLILRMVNFNWKRKPQ